MASNVIGMLGRRFFWLLVAVAHLAACTTFNVRVDDPELPPARIQPILESVGVYYGPEFRRIDIDDYVFKSHDETLDYDFEMVVKTDLGPASVAMFDSILESAFPNAVRVDQAEPDIRHAVVLTPSLLGFDYEFDPSSADVSVDVDYQLMIRSLERPPTMLEVRGRYEMPREHRSAFAPIWSVAPGYIQEAMRDAGNELIFLFHEAAGADDWLAELERHAVSSNTATRYKKDPE